MLMDQSMIDAASGGALMEKTPAAMRHLISNMARNTQQFGIRGAITNKVVNKVGIVNNLRMENQLTELTSFVRQLAVSQHQQILQVEVCGISTSVEHFIDVCPTLRKPKQLTIHGRMDEVSREYERHNAQFENADWANSITAGSRNLPSQPILNPKGGNVSIVTLRSGKELQVAPRPKPNLTNIESEPEVDFRAKTTPLPFPSRTFSVKKPKTDEELLKMFRILLLDAIKQIPKYVKFLKELCIHKRNKLKEGAEVGGVLSAFIQKEVTVGTKPALPRKCRDPGISSVPCTISGCTFTDAMLDLRASINVMPTSVYKSLNFGDLEPTIIVIQLANRSVVQPIVILEDVLIQVNDLIFLTDFYVLEMEDETFRKGST
ncbi:hypothetical protein CR513_03630, partial [Mucuna pruriens]